jgi:hypothetical protein
LTDSNQPPNSNNDKPADAARPEWLPEKFKTPQDLVKSYSELEKKVGTPPEKQEGDKAADKAEPGVQAAQSPTETPETPLPSNKTASEVEAKIKELEKQVVDSGMDMAALRKEYMDTDGAMTEDTLRRLAQAFKTDQVRTIIDEVAGAEKVKAEYQAKLERMEHAKSLKMTEAELDDLVNWTVNLSEQDLASYDALIATKDEKNIRMALKFAKLQRESVEGKTPNYVQGRSAPMEQGYLSAAEVRRDMADPRYISGDPAFHAAVDAKMARSNREAWKDR